MSDKGNYLTLQRISDDEYGISGTAETIRAILILANLRVTGFEQMEIGPEIHLVNAVLQTPKKEDE